VDFASLIGLALALAGICSSGIRSTAGSFASLIQPAAFAIVVVGTFGAVLLQSEARTFRRGMRMLRWVFFPPKDKPPAAVARDRAVEPYGAARRPAVARAVHGHERPVRPEGPAPGGRRHHIPTSCAACWKPKSPPIEFAERQAARIWESAAGYAPTIGILGAVLGLIHVMENLSDPARLGSGIAVAFVSTVYGVGLANLFFLPVGNKLKAIVADQVAQYEILTEVFHDLASGNHTRVVEERVASLLAKR
jgi:chemotaxis protein MotA